MTETTVTVDSLDNQHRYRDRYRLLVKWIFILSVLAIVLLLVLGFQVMKKPNYKFYATTTTGILKPLHPLSRPMVSHSYLFQWASTATRQAFNLQFVNLNEDLSRAQGYFTSGGWEKFLQALKTSGLRQRVLGEKLDMTAIVSNTPVILHQGVLHGRYTWRVQLPLLVTFSSASQVEKIKLLVIMDIARVPTLNDPRGIQITDFSAQQNYIS